MQTIRWLIITASVSATGFAFNKPTHQRLVDDAWNLLVYLDANPPPAGEGPSPARIKGTLSFFRNKQSRLPAASAVWTASGALIDPSTLLLKDLVTSPAIGMRQNATPVKQETFLPSGIFKSQCMPGAPCEQTGHVLGWWAANVDLLNDTWGDYRPWYADGVGTVVDKVNSLVKDTTRIVIASIFCIVTLGLWDGCADTADEIADKINPLNAAYSLTSGWGLNGSNEIFDGRNLTSMWHFTNVPGNQSRYDDNDGIAGMSESAPGPSIIDLGLYAYSSALGFSLQPDQTPPVTNYAIVGGNDGHPDSMRRDDSEWRAPYFGALVFGPGDNAAKYGWDQWKRCQDVRSLGYVMHMAADAAIIQHVASTLGWGHQPFEDYIENNYEQQTLYGDNAGAAAAQGQIAEIVSDLQQWLQQVQSWQQADATRGRDVDVRGLVTSMAQRAWSEGQVQYDLLVPVNLAGVVPEALYQKLLSKDYLRKSVLHPAVALMAALLIVSAEYASFTPAETCSAQPPGMRPGVGAAPDVLAAHAPAHGGQHGHAGQHDHGRVLAVTTPEPSVMRRVLDARLEPYRVQLRSRQITPEQFWQKVDREYFRYAQETHGGVDDLRLDTSVALAGEQRRLARAWIEQTMPLAAYATAARNLASTSQRLLRDRDYARAWLAGGDPDKDYVPEPFDRCPGTPPATLVGADGCPRPARGPELKGDGPRDQIKNSYFYYDPACMGDTTAPDEPQWVCSSWSTAAGGGRNWYFEWTPVQDCDVRYVLDVRVLQAGGGTASRTFMVPPSMIKPGRTVSSDVSVTFTPGASGAAGQIAALLSQAQAADVDLAAVDGGANYSGRRPLSFRIDRRPVAVSPRCPPPQ
jgi:hypothetical protein